MVNQNVENLDLDLSEYDGIIHLAAMHYIPDCNLEPSKCRRINVNGTKRLLTNASPDIPIVYASSAAVYCNSKNTSDTPPDMLNTTAADTYSKSKIDAELLIRQYSNCYSILRFFNVYGSYDPHEHLIPKLFLNLKNRTEAKLGSSTSIRDYVHVDDVANGVVYALDALFDNENSFIADLGTGTGTSVSDISRLINSLAHTSYDMELLTNFNNVESMRDADISVLIAQTERLQKLGFTAKKYLQEGISEMLSEMHI
jgi:UDP-glucose 4-epimerase